MSGRGEVRVDRVVVDAGQTDTAMARRLREQTAEQEIAVEPPRVSDYRDGKRILHLDRKRGTVLHDCASMDERYRCCNVKVLGTVSNCPYECSYCFLQNYLTDTTLSVVADTPAILAEVKEAAERQPWRLWRIGTWELGDSLALETLSGAAGELVDVVARLPNVVLELKTKSADVAGLLGRVHGGRTVVSWTLNPEAVVKREELRTASIDERIAVMARVAADGYPVALHFDPMIHYPEWQSGYAELVAALFAAIDPAQVAWISIGSLRFNPEMRKVMAQNYPGSRATWAEMVLGDDNKVRYVKPLRLEMYRHLRHLLQGAGADQALIYLCMERWDVWERVLGRAPESRQHLDYEFARSLADRFPQFSQPVPFLPSYLEDG